MSTYGNDSAPPCFKIAAGVPLPPNSRQSMIDWAVNRPSDGSPPSLVLVNETARDFRNWKPDFSSNYLKGEALLLKIKVEDFRAFFWARSLNRFFQRAFPLLRLRVLSGFQCRVRYAKFTMLKTSEPHPVKGVALNFLCLRSANWTRRHRNSLPWCRK